jgi:hypothetical protein
MRVVGGRLRGRAIASPASHEIRPTADRLREALFNILMHAYDNPVDGARVLDLFAGTGALGIEAISRGAAFTLFVDNGAEARASGSAASARSIVVMPPNRDRRIRWSRFHWRSSIRLTARVSRKSPSPRCATAAGSRPARW